MKKCRCKCRRAGAVTTPQSAALTAPLTRGAGEKRRDVQTVKECQDWLISEYDLEIKRLEAELNEALDMLATLMEALRRLVRPEESGTGKASPTEREGDNDGI